LDDAELLLLGWVLLDGVLLDGVLMSFLRCWATLLTGKRVKAATATACWEAELFGGKGVTV
jgi:hypothetical protein